MKTNFLCTAKLLALQNPSFDQLIIRKTLINLGLDTTSALLWGVGQTVVHAVFGTTRILATL